MRPILVAQAPYLPRARGSCHPPLRARRPATRSTSYPRNLDAVLLDEFSDRIRERVLAICAQDPHRLAHPRERDARNIVRNSGGISCDLAGSAVLLRRRVSASSSTIP